MVFKAALANYFVKAWSCGISTTACLPYTITNHKIDPSVYCQSEISGFSDSLMSAR